MIPNYSNIHNRFKINGFLFDKESLLQFAHNFIKEGQLFEKEIGLFLLDWLDNKDYVFSQTSGTTGKPKAIKINKQAMVNSAIATGNFFKLNPGDKALHCLPCQFIAGKMMLVRAIVLGLEINLVFPTGTFLANATINYDFAAMVPLQVENNFQYLNQIKTLIIGGAQPSNNLRKALKKLKTVKVYETYGMTETITHIAAKKINAQNFKVLPDIIIEKDKRDCLVINAPRIAENQIITNDLVEIVSKNQFKWLGRIDNVINSGGVKLFPEQIERKIKLEQRFFITSRKDEKLGEKVVLVIESERRDLETTLFSELNKYEIPKEIYFIPQFIETKTGKIKRKETLEKERTVR